MIDEKLTRDLLSAIEEHCDSQLAKLNPQIGGQEAYDHGTYTGVKVMINRIRSAITAGELDPRESHRIKNETSLAVMGKDRKVFIINEEDEQHAAG